MSDATDDLGDLDGCQAMLNATGYDDPLTAHLRPLFPRGAADSHLTDEWLSLFGDCGIPDELGT